MVAVELEACVVIVNGSTTIPLEVTLHHMLCWLLIPRGWLFVLLTRDSCFFHVSQLQSCSKFFVFVVLVRDSQTHMHRIKRCN